MQAFYPSEIRREKCWQSAQFFKPIYFTVYLQAQWEEEDLIQHPNVSQPKEPPFFYLEPVKQ